MMPEATHVYMDLDVINNDYTTGSAPQLRFEEVRNAPFLEGDASEYACSVVRFSVQTSVGRHSRETLISVFSTNIRHPQTRFLA